MPSLLRIRTQMYPTPSAGCRRHRCSSTVVCSQNIMVLQTKKVFVCLRKRCAGLLVEKSGVLLWTRAHRAKAINQSADKCISPTVHYRSGEVGRKRSGDAVSGVEPKASRIFVVDVAIEEIRDYPQHWCKEAYFIARLAAKDSKSLHLQNLLSLLLKPQFVLPGEVRVMPVSCWH
jgi:hypothetical protein